MARYLSTSQSNQVVPDHLKAQGIEDFVALKSEEDF
jgi:hypothetical protein